MNLQRIAIVAVIVAALVAAAWYISEAPYNQMFGATVTQVPVHQKVVALTFDDGPNPPYTNEIVAYLHGAHVVATFFVVGKAVAAHPEILRAELRDGDALGNHTWDHAHLVLLSRRHVEREIDDCENAIYQATGTRPTLFRPPFGARDFLVLRVARDKGYRVIMWSVPLPADWTGPAPLVIAKRVLAHVKNGSIIVLHDGDRGRSGDRHSTVEATRLIVMALRAQGYGFLTVPQLLKLGYPNEPVPAGPTENDGTM
jgi:peptidoglycan/xylan/chitin deacetylase (PgdA/CDA1 family)